MTLNKFLIICLFALSSCTTSDSYCTSRGFIIGTNEYESCHQKRYQQLKSNEEKYNADLKYCEEYSLLLFPMPRAVFYLNQFESFDNLQYEEMDLDWRKRIQAREICMKDIKKWNN